jgi:GntR family transcriptional regulator
MKSATDVEQAATARASSSAALLSTEPLYLQVKQRVIRGILDGEWKPGEQLPVESELAARYGVGVSTIRSAVGHLVAGHVLARKQGKGTFVCLQDDRRSVYQFFRVVRDDGRKELPVSELIGLKKVKADADVAGLLDLPRRSPGQDVYRLRNVLRVGGIAVVVSDITIPAALFRGLNEAIARSGSTLYAVYQTHFGINIVRTAEELRAVKASSAVAKVLALCTGDPVLEVRRLAYTFGDRPIEVRTSAVLTRNFFYMVESGRGM